MRYLKIFFVILLLGSNSFLYANDKKLNKITENNDFKLAVIDMHLILENSTAMLSIRKAVENIHHNLEKEFAEKELELKKIDESLIEKRKKTNNNNLEEDMEFEKKITLVQREVQEKKQKLELAHRQAISKVHKAINNIVATFSKKNNISVVLYNTQTIFADKKLNISLEIISLLNQKLKFVQLNY